MQNQMGENYEIKVPNQVDMKVKITGTSFLLAKNVIIKKFKGKSIF